MHHGARYGSLITNGAAQEQQPRAFSYHLEPNQPNRPAVEPLLPYGRSPRTDCTAVDTREQRAAVFARNRLPREELIPQSVYENIEGAE